MTNDEIKALASLAPLLALPNKTIRKRLVEHLREAAMFQRHDPSTRTILLMAAMQIEDDAAEFAAERDALREDAEKLRHLLALRVGGALLYTDDGELQCNRDLPSIDFKRDSVAEIEQKLIDRGLRNFCREFSAELAAQKDASENPASRSA